MQLGVREAGLGKTWDNSVFVYGAERLTDLDGLRLLKDASGVIPLETGKSIAYTGTYHQSILLLKNGY